MLVSFTFFCCDFGIVLFIFCVFILKSILATGYGTDYTIFPDIVNRLNYWTFYGCKN